MAFGRVMRQRLFDAIAENDRAGAMAKADVNLRS
jgi:hypothetical protein